LTKDREYEIAHLSLSADFKAGRLTQVQFDAAHAEQWREYLDWAKGFGLYEQITPEQQLAEAENRLAVQVEQVNLIRSELERPLIKIREQEVTI